MIDIAFNHKHSYKTVMYFYSIILKKESYEMMIKFWLTKNIKNYILQYSSKNIHIEFLTYLLFE